MVSPIQTVKTFKVAGKEYHYYSVTELEKQGYNVRRLPLSLRIILESMLRNLDGKTVKEDDVKRLLDWNSKEPADEEIPFKVSRVVMQDFTGVPAVVDLAAMRDTMKSLGKDPLTIQPSVPVDLVIDHSVQVDFYGTPDSVDLNRDKEFERNKERYKFLKWAQNSFDNLRIIPPSVGIVHQVNLEYLAKVVMIRNIDGKLFAFPDSLVGTDSHTTMVDALGVVGWGVGGIEAEAAMLDQPVTFKTPKVVGVHLHRKLPTGVTATDLVLTLTEILRKHKVVGKFVEFYGDGIKSLALPDRATLSNMCPEYGATIALFPIDEETLKYLKATGRDEEQIELVRKYLEAQDLFGVKKDIEYSETVDLDLSTVVPSVSGPKLPQQRMKLSDIGNSFLSFIEKSSEPHEMQNGHVSKEVALKSSPIQIKGKPQSLRDGDIVIAAITSCTNTSNPQVMIAAGLLARKAVEMGLKVNPKVKTSLAPGSRVVSEYLEKAGLQRYLNDLGFYLVGYGCTTCIGNSGPLDKEIEDAILKDDLTTAAVLSGNRNFEARIHRNVKANYLMSPPLVVAFAIAGSVVTDLEHEPLGVGKNGKEVFLKDIWPTEEEISSVINGSISSEMFRKKYEKLDDYNEKWKVLESPPSETYDWDEESTYIRNPPFFDGFGPKEPELLDEVNSAMALLVLGDSVTTDHISPAGAISKDSPAGRYLMDHGVDPVDFNTFGSRRGNHEVMMRGTFGNNRLKNRMVEKEGGYTQYIPSDQTMPVYDAAMKYLDGNVPLLVFAGAEYGTGSSRDWAAKGTYLLGIKAVIAKSYERIHRSNLIGMGVLPLQFKESEDFHTIDADEKKEFDLKLPEKLTPGSETELLYTDSSGKRRSATVKVRLDTQVEVEYYRNGGILQYVLRKLL